MSYIPLESDHNVIRLIHLLPALLKDDTIRCRFTVALLDDQPQYKALSYVWGGRADAELIEVEGHSVRVTANLHSALTHLPHRDQEQVLWVDALRINQCDLQERRHQVSRMTAVYGQASQVLVWLGKSWDGCDKAVEFLHRLANDANLHLDPSLHPSISVHGFNLADKELREPIFRLFESPWWTRTWTVQEFVLAQNLVFQCSDHSVSREIMNMAQKNLWKHVEGCCGSIDQGTLLPESTCGSSKLSSSQPN